MVNEFWLISSRLYRKAQGKACTHPGLQEQKERLQIDGLWCNEDRIMSGMEVRQGEAWPSFGECEVVFISFKLFSPADGHP